MDLISLSIIALLFLIVIVLAVLLVITAPVAIPYFKASFSKDKYALLTISKNGTMQITPAKFRNGRAVVNNGLAKFLKMGLTGSNSIGNIRCDIVHADVAVIEEPATNTIFNELSKAGINDINDLTRRANQAILLRMGILQKEEFTDAELQVIKSSSDYLLNNLELYAPVIQRVYVQDMIRNCTINPQTLASDVAEDTAIIARQYKELLLGSKNLEGGSADNGKKIIIICIVLVIVGLAAAFFMMKG